MSDLNVSTEDLDRSSSDRARAILDWAVFSLGVASLTVAITATVLTHANDVETASVTQEDDVLVTSVQDVL